MSAEPAVSYRVLSLARGVAGAFALRLLTDLGARCSHWAWSEPRPGDWPDDDQFRGYFLRGVDEVARPETFAGVMERLPSLADAFDLVVTDWSAAEMAEGALVARLRRYNPALVVANADHFGRSGPYAMWTGDELTDYAIGGYWALAGDPGRAPLRVPGYHAQFHAGMHLMLASLAALRHARLTGEGQEVEATAVEAMLGSHWQETTGWTHTGSVYTRVGSDLMRAKDGWVHIAKHGFAPNVFILMGRPELIDDPRWNTEDGWTQHIWEIWGLLAEWCRDQRVEDVVLEGQALRLLASPAADAARLLADDSLREREFFIERDGIRDPGLPYRWAPGWAHPDALPRLAALLDAPPEPRFIGPAVPQSGVDTRSAGPLSGVRVLELTLMWGGPVAARHLADLGAEVIKIELPSRPASRISDIVGRNPGLKHWNQSAFFNQMNRNKRGIGLNLATARGKVLFLDLVRESDVVVQNNSARVLPNLGLGYDVLSGVNPRLVMASITGFGSTGPKRDWVANGSNIEAASGLATLTGYDADRPYRTGSYVPDPIAGALAAAAVIAALERRDRTGRGSDIDVSLNESTMLFLLIGFTHYQRTGKLYPPLGGADPWDAPTGAYRAGGADHWVAIAVRTDEQWRTLARLARFPAEDAALTKADRIARREAIDARLSAWTATLGQYDCARLLQEHGVPAAPILHNWQFTADPHLFARGSFVPIEHPDVGVLPYPGFPWRFSATQPRIRMSAPQFGEGNDYVFRKLLGLSDTEVDELYTGGVTADAPLGATVPLLRY